MVYASTLRHECMGHLGLACTCDGSMGIGYGSVRKSVEGYCSYLQPPDGRWHATCTCTTTKYTVLHEVQTLQSAF